jgi:hypothetical protein
MAWTPPLRTVVKIDGREVEVAPAFAGGEARYEDWMYLEMIEREWRRPVGPGEAYDHFPEDVRPSARAVSCFSSGPISRRRSSDY